MTVDVTPRPEPLGPIGPHGLYDEDYLGDAVYAGHDGYMLWLVTGDGNNQRIALEPAVLHALTAYLDRIKARYGRGLA